MNNEAEKISVIIPVYNVEKYLDRCIQSVVNQTYKNLEIILVDDGSPDRCGEMCDAWAKKDDRIRVIHRANNGLSDARNEGLDSSTGAYIAFVDSDDFIDREMLNSLYEKLTEEKADMVVCGFAFVDKQGRFIRSWQPKEEGIIDSGAALAMLADEQLMNPGVWNKLYSRSVWESLRFPIGKLCEDDFIMHEILYRCRRIFLMKDLFYQYVQQKNSIMRSAKNIKSWDNIEAIYSRVLFYEQHGLQQTLSATASLVLDKYFHIRKDVPLHTKEEKKRHCEAKQMVRYCIRKYGKHISRKEVLSFEAPGLFRFCQRIKKQFRPSA